jgi:hypothetical protein
MLVQLFFTSFKRIFSAPFWIVVILGFNLLRLSKMLHINKKSKYFLPQWVIHMLTHYKQDTHSYTQSLQEGIWCLCKTLKVKTRAGLTSHIFLMVCI